MTSVREAQVFDVHELAKMRVALWPETSFEEELKDVEKAITTGMSGTLPITILVAHDEHGSLTGFLDVGMRSHADGCDPAQPVGFVEGWFVYPAFRNQGIGRQLMRSAEDWARARGCLEMASDTWIDNEQSQRAHEALGFEIVDRCVNFRKSLNQK